jgi:hypothetical protein
MSAPSISGPHLEVVNQTLLIERPSDPGSDPQSGPKVGFVPLTPEASAAIALAKQTACSLGHSVTSSGHLLLGLLMQHTGLAAQVLESRGVAVEQLKPKILRPLTSLPSAMKGFSSSASQGLSQAVELILELGQTNIDTGHILLGLLRQGRRQQGEAHQLLRSLGVNCTFLAHQLRFHLDEGVQRGLEIDRERDRIARTITVQLTTQLLAWVGTHRLGQVLSPGPVLRLIPHHWHRPSIALFLKASIQPDVVIDVKTSRQPLLDVHRYLQAWLKRGCHAGVIINPEEHTVTLYRPNDRPRVLSPGAVLTLPDYLPHWRLPIQSLWPATSSDRPI